MSGRPGWWRGSVLAEVRGPAPEHFLNLCARNNVAFSSPERLDTEVLRLRMRRRDYRRMAAETEGAYVLHLLKSGGLPELVRRLRGRHVLLAVTVLCLLALYALAARVWKIEITGNETVPTERILVTLDQLGLRPGVRASGVDSYRLRNRALLQLDELIWLSVNVRGCRAEVQVRERSPRPEVTDMGLAADVVADCPGLITEVRVYRGAGLVQVGQTVDRGDVLIAGRVEGLSGQQQSVRALGEIRARTWYTMQAQIPLEYLEKVYTGETTVRRRLIFGRQTVNLYFNSGIPYEYCDKIIRRSSGELLDVVASPVTLVQEIWRQYEPVTVTMDRAEAEALLTRQLTGRLEQQVGSGEIRAVDIVCREEGGVLKATLYAECLEQIGAQALPMPGNTEE